MAAMSTSYAHGAADTPLLGETIGRSLLRTAARFPDGEALVARAQGYRATWRELVAQSGALGRGLLAAGVHKGDRVGLWSPNRAEWVVAQFACARVGAILVNLNPAYKTSEVEYALRQSGTSVLLHAHAFRTTDYRAMVEAVRGRLPDLRRTVSLDDDLGALVAAGAAIDEAALAAREAATPTLVAA